MLSQYITLHKTWPEINLLIQWISILVLLLLVYKIVLITYYIISTLYSLTAILSFCDTAGECSSSYYSYGDLVKNTEDLTTTEITNNTCFCTTQIIINQSFEVIISICMRNKDPHSHSWAYEIKSYSTPRGEQKILINHT